MTYQNAKSAKNVGIELDFRKDFEFLGAYGSDFYLAGNAAWIERYIKYFYREGRIVEVYNLLEDRFEENNLVSQYSEKAKEISNRIMQWNFSCKKSHGGADYSTDFTPVNQWRGIDKFQHK